MTGRPLHWDVSNILFIGPLNFVANSCMYGNPFRKDECFFRGGIWNPRWGGSPSKRYWQKVKAVAEALSNCWHLQPTEEAQSSPADGPSGIPPPHVFFGHWSSSGEDDPLPPKRTGGGSGDPPIRMGVNRYLAEVPSGSTLPPADPKWDSTVTDVMRREARMSLSDPLEGWPTRDQEWATTIGRLVFSDDVFSGIKNDFLCV